MYYFYVLESDLGELYFGSTNDLKRRLKEHQTRKVRTTKNSNLTLVYYEAYLSEADARDREHNVKHNGGSKRALKQRIFRSRQ